MTARAEITMDAELQLRAQARAAELGMTFSEYLRRLVANDLSRPAQKGEVTDRPPVSAIFDLVDDGEPSDIARDKDKMVGEAVWAEYLRKTGQTDRDESARS